MADRPTLNNPRVHVVMADGAEWDAQSINPDLLRYERTAAKYKWPGPSSSPVTWLTFMAWAAGTREGHIPPSMTWEQFSRTECVDVTNPDGKAAPPAVDPTDPEVDTD